MILHKKGITRPHFKRKLRSFNVCSKTLEIFYQAVVADAIYLPATFSACSISAMDASRMNKLIHKARTIIHQNPEAFESVWDRRTLNNLLSIMDNPLHHSTLHSLSLIQPCCHEERFRTSFLQFSIKL